MPAFLTVHDLTPFATIDPARAEAMIEDATARAVLAAPPLARLLDLYEPGPGDAARIAAVRAILRGAIVRWHEAGTGAITQHQQSAGPWSDMRTFQPAATARGVFTVHEIRDLRAVCAPGRFSTVDLIPDPSPGDRHAPWCAEHTNPGCSCGAIIAGEPIFLPGRP